MLLTTAYHAGVDLADSRDTSSSRSSSRHQISVCYVEVAIHCLPISMSIVYILIVLTSIWPIIVHVVAL